MHWRAFLAAALLLPALLVLPVSAADAPAAEWEERFKALRAEERAQVFDVFEQAAGAASVRLGPDQERRSDLVRALAGDDDRAPQYIFGPDDRQQASPANPKVAYIEAVDLDTEQGVQCSATFIGPRVLLTAAHCIYIAELGGWPDSVVVVPGKDGETEPYGFDFAEALFVPDGWATGDPNSVETTVHDYGVILLPSNQLGNQVGWYSMGSLTDGTLLGAGLNPRMTGYPGDKPSGTQWTQSVSGLDSVSGTYLFSQLDLVSGQSGSPVMRGFDAGIIGIASFEMTDNNGQFNVARRVTGEVVSFVLGICAEVSCTFGHFEEPQDGETSAIYRTWQRTDQPVADLLASRTWMWGPAANTGIFLETYTEGPNGARVVIYYDKSRMEITIPGGDPNSPWYVTNGLLVVELVTGRLQLGDTTFEQFDPAQVNVAGDADDADGPTYATFGGLLGASPLATGSVVTATVDRAGTVGDNPALGSHNVTASQFVPETNHTVASVFWDFMNSQGLVYENGGTSTALLFQNAFFATGFPITEPYWARVKVGGTVKDVLIQVFERRVMTYTPSNSGGFQVESGNVGQHYRTWRYEQIVDSEIPELGEQIGGTDFSDIGPLDSPTGATGDSTENSYLVTLPPMSSLGLFFEVTPNDYAVAVETRVSVASELTLSCVIYRVNDASEYDYCMVADLTGVVGLAVLYLTTTSGETLAEAVFETPLPHGEWHLLAAIVQGGSAWFVFDDTLVGRVDHTGAAEGDVGVVTYNLAETGDNSQVELTNLFAWNLVE